MMIRTKRHYIWFLFYESAYLWTYAKKRFFGSDLHLLMGSWLYLYFVLVFDKRSFSSPGKFVLFESQFRPIWAIYE